jgi:hypothetical protein
VVVVLIVGLKDVTPVPPLTIEPPLKALYQSMVQPFGAVALKVTAPATQRELLLGLVGAVGRAFITPPVLPEYPL